jgi:hypothetical protein
MCPGDPSSTSSEDSYETAKSSQEPTKEEQKDSEADRSHPLDVKVVADGSEIIDMQESLQMARNNLSRTTTLLEAMVKACFLKSPLDQQKTENKLVGTEYEWERLRTVLKRLQNKLGKCEGRLMLWKGEFRNAKD